MKFQDGIGGRIVNIASIAGIGNGLTFTRHHQYHASKFGVVSYSRHFGECNPADNPWLVDGVKCYAVCPWFVDTVMIRDPGASERQKQSLQEKLKKARPLTTKEVVDVCMVSLDDDNNGSVRVVLPGIPPIKLPNYHSPLLILTVAVAKVWTLVFPQTKQIHAYHALLAVAFLLAVFSFFMGILFNY